MHISLVVKLQWVLIAGLVAVIILQYSVIQRYEKNADEHVKIGAQSQQEIEELTNRPNCTASAMKIVNVPIVQPQQVKIPHGVAVTTFLGAPKWFQNRYSLMVNQVLTMLEDDWVVQIIYDPSQKMALEGISYPGIQRQVRRGNVILTPIPTDMKKIKKNALLLTSWFWRSLVADKVLLFGGTAALCANTPFEVANFTHFDYIGAPWGGYSGQGGEGGVSIRNRATILRAVLELENHASTAQSGGNNGGGKEDAVLVRALLGMGAQVTVASKEVRPLTNHLCKACFRYVCLLILSRSRNGICTCVM